MARLAHVQAQVPLLLVFVGVAVGLAVTSASRPVLGCGIIGGSFVVGGLLRSVLSERAAGLLANRGRTFDSWLLVGLGVAVLALIVSLRADYQG